VVLQAKLFDMGEPKALLALFLDPPDLTNLENTILLLKEVSLLCTAVQTLCKGLHLIVIEFVSLLSLFYNTGQACPRTHPSWVLAVLSDF
jgi:hypothetical protein